MDHFDKELQELVAKGKSQGYLTYDEVIRYLPDEAVNPEKLDTLLIQLDEQGIELVNEVPKLKLFEAPERPMRKGDRERLLAEADLLAAEESGNDPEGKHSAVEDKPKWSNDPIRLYLSQMAEIPLLARDEEIGLAKKIEVTRKRFRRTVIGCNLAMRSTVSTLMKVHGGVLPFDRTVKVSLTERLTKEQIIARMPHNLKTLAHLMDENQRDFLRLIHKRTSAEERAEARTRFIRRRRKTLILVEELSLRTRRVQAMMRQMEEIWQRMAFLRKRIRERNDQPGARSTSG